MKKSYLLIAAAIALSLSNLNAQDKDYLINEDFESGTVGEAFDFGLSGNFATNSKIKAMTEPYNNVLDTYAGSIAATHSGVKDLGTLEADSDGKLYLDFDWYVNNGQSLYVAGNGGYVLFKDADNKLILGLNVAKDAPKGIDDVSTGNFLHLLNLDNTVVDDPAALGTVIIPDNYVAGSIYFNRQDEWVHIHAILNFTAKTVEKITITNTKGASYEKTNLTFHDNTAGMLKNFELKFLFAGSNGTRWRPLFDNFQIYRMTSGENTGITNNNYGKTVESIECFDLFGRQIIGNTQNTNDIVIEKTFYTDGSMKVVKKIIK